MSMAQRLHKIRLSHPAASLPLDHWTNPAQTTPECQRVQAKVREGDEGVKNHWLATQRKPLEEVEPIALLRWLLRKYFAWRGFACRSHCGECDGKCYASIEYRGTFDNEADARWAANCPGGEVKPIPFEAALPEETVSYGVGDVPQSEASQFYRQGVPLPFVAVPREELDELPRNKLKRLREKIQATDPIVEGMRVKAT